MGDRTRGIYDKFFTERRDGKSAPGKKHDGCDYFVLDMTHDPFAAAALRAYRDACAAEYPLLAADMLEMTVCGERVFDVGQMPAISAPTKLGPCDHKSYESGQKVEGGIDKRTSTCVKCGAVRP